MWPLPRSLGGLGISSLINLAGSISWKKLTTLISLAMAPAAVSALLAFWHPLDSQMRIDQASGFVQFNWKFWSINAACLIGMLVTWSLTRNQFRFLKLAGFIAFAVLAIGNLLFIAHNALPLRPYFNYPKDLSKQMSIDNNSRFLTVGSGILRHNTNLIYGLRNIQTYAPLLPKNFVEFMEACGAQTNDRFSQIFSPLISSNIDLTGTSTIISQQPLLDESIAAMQSARKGAATFANQLKLSNIEFFRDSKAGNIFCSLLANPDLPANENCTLYIEITEANGARHALGDPQPIAGWRLNQNLCFSGSIPNNKKHWALSARLISDRDTHLIHPISSTLGSINPDGSWIIAAANESKLFTEIENHRFKPVSTYHNIITYKNQTALNRYFLQARFYGQKIARTN